MATTRRQSAGTKKGGTAVGGQFAPGPAADAPTTGRNLRLDGEDGQWKTPIRHELSTEEELGLLEHVHRKVRDQGQNLGTAFTNLAGEIRLEATSGFEIAYDKLYDWEELTAVGDAEPGAVDKSIELQRQNRPKPDPVEQMVMTSSAEMLDALATSGQMTDDRLRDVIDLAVNRLIAQNPAVRDIQNELAADAVDPSDWYMTSDAILRRKERLKSQTP